MLRSLRRCHGILGRFTRAWCNSRDPRRCLPGRKPVTMRMARRERKPAKGRATRCSRTIGVSVAITRVRGRCRASSTLRVGDFRRVDFVDRIAQFNRPELRDELSNANLGWLYADVEALVLGVATNLQLDSLNGTRWIQHATDVVPMNGLNDTDMGNRALAGARYTAALSGFEAVNVTP